MSERPYKGVVLACGTSVTLTDEDFFILYNHGPGMLNFYGRSDRSDACKMLALVDSAPKKEELQDRRD